jgi:hypothetical protein
MLRSLFEYLIALGARARRIHCHVAHCNFGCNVEIVGKLLLEVEKNLSGIGLTPRH